MSEVVSFRPNDQLGTLLWIGDSTSPDFHDAFEFCVSSVAQLAMRRDLNEAIHRPAASVRHILIAQTTRQPGDQRSLNRLATLYPTASFLHLLGTLCEGMRTPAGSVLEANRHYWHRWNQVLPQWLEVRSASPESAKQKRCVAVVTSSYAAGESLMDLAESAGATAVWCRGADTHRVRNVDVVWWDDSVAGPVSSSQWRERIATFANAGHRPKHAWIVHSPRFEQRREAINGGVDVVVSKPHLIDCLLDMLEKPDVTSATQSRPIRRAA